jgi:tricorn protease
MKKLLGVCLILLAPGLAPGQANRPLLLQKPAVSRTHVVFAFADDLWIVSRKGGEAKRLTSGPGVETDPVFSPDGKRVAFTGEYEGNTDVYVVGAEGGVPKRLTYHPGQDRAVGWTPDGKNVLFLSTRDSYSRFGRLFTMPVEGGFPTEVPLPMAHQGSYSPDGKHLAYTPVPPAFRIWKRYRGGLASYVWLARLSDSSITKVPREDSNDFNPMWVGERVYFLSDRDGPVTLYCYDTKTKKVRRVLENKGLDLKSASAGPDVIAYERFGEIHLFDPKTEKSRRLEVTINADLPTVRPRFVKVGKQVQSARISPTGVRAVFEARGEILTVPAKKGDVRNLTQTPGVAERDPAWSPDGQWIAYFSDESGEYRLHVRPQKGDGKVKKYDLGKSPSFYYSPVWSPDSKKIAYTDKRLNIWYLDLESGKSTLVDTNPYAPTPRPPVWSPDGRWLAYARQLKNHLHAVFLHSLKEGKSHRVTDGMSDAQHVQFDKGGEHLYFTASTDAGPTTGGIEMSNFNFPVTRSVYVVVLRKDKPSPLAPESDEEKDAAKEGKKEEKKKEEKEKKKAPEVRIDLEDIDQRILALPIPARGYVSLLAGKSGVLFLAENPLAPVSMEMFAGPAPRVILHRFDLKERKVEKFLDGVNSAVISHDGEKLLVRQGDGWSIVGTGSAPKSGEGALKMDALEVRVDPPAEWRQMYREVWRIERDFLYDPHYHGLDLRATAKRYQPYVDGLGSRNDLNYLFGEMLGNLTLGHVYVGGGDAPQVKEVKGGLLGADYKVENGRYRFARIYRGENWDPSLKAPLTQPGVNVKEGDYLLAVGGKEVKAPDNLYKFFEATAGKSVVLRVGPKPDGTGSREVTVVPVESEANLRNRAWVESNRRKVAKLTGGRVAYVYLPDTFVGGYTQFNRYFFAQVDKEGVVVDERFNGGGKAADYIIGHLSRKVLNYWSTREGEDYATPTGAIFGAKAMIVNEYAGSGGDWLPWAFRRAKLGPLVGKRTWGGLVGIGGYPTLVDGGSVTAPHFAFWNPEGEWEVENRGVAPDVEVEFDPAAWREGRDPQLEKAVALVLEGLKKHPVKKPRRPAYPDYYRGKGARTGGPAREKPAGSGGGRR